MKLKIIILLFLNLSLINNINSVNISSKLIDAGKYLGLAYLFLSVSQMIHEIGHFSAGKLLLDKNKFDVTIPNILKSRTIIKAKNKEENVPEAQDLIILLSGPIIELITLKTFKQLVQKFITNQNLKQMTKMNLNFLSLIVLINGLLPAWKETDGFKIWNKFINENSLKKCTIPPDLIILLVLGTFIIPLKELLRTNNRI